MVSNKSFVRYFAVLLILSLFLGGWYLYSKPKVLNREECFKLGSNERMFMCLEEVKRQESQAEDANWKPKAGVKIIDLSSTVLHIKNGTVTFEATFKNNDEVTYKDPVIRILLYFDQTAECDPAKAYETAYMTWEGVLPAGTTKRVKLSADTAIPNNSYVYCPSTEVVYVPK